MCIRDSKKHNIEIVVDRLVIREDIARRLTDSVEVASNLAGGLVVINVVGEDRDILFSQNYACEDCGVSIEELTPRMFSFNNPFGACPTCTGLGLSLIHISEPTRQAEISYAVFCLKKKKKQVTHYSV